MDRGWSEFFKPIRAVSPILYHHVHLLFETKKKGFFCISSFTESLLGRGLALPGLYWLFCSTINTILSSLIYIFLIRWERGAIQKEAEQWSRRVTVLLCWLTELHFSCALWPVVPLHSRTVLVQSMVWLTCASLEKRFFSYCAAFTALARTHKCPISGKDRAEAELISREGAELEKGI